MIVLLLAASPGVTADPNFDREWDRKAVAAFERSLDTHPLALGGVSPSSQANSTTLEDFTRLPGEDDIDGDTLRIRRTPDADVWVTLEEGRVVHVSEIVVGSGSHGAFDPIRSLLSVKLGADPEKAHLDVAEQHALIPVYTVKPRGLVDGLRWHTPDGQIDLFAVDTAVIVALSRTGEDALQQEVCADLAHFWTAERAFHGEYGTWTTDLQSINWAPRDLPHAVYGFCEASREPITGITDFQPARSTTADPTLQMTMSFSGSETSGIADPCGTLRRLGIRDSFTASGAGWRAFAIGRVGPGDDGLRVWTIGDDRKVSRLR